MAATIGRVICRRLLSAKTPLLSQQVGVSTKHGAKQWSKGRKVAAGLLGTATAGGVALVAALQGAVYARDLELHPYNHKWPHSGYFSALDHASVRRGYQVYKEVCAACHSMNYMYYRQLVDVIFTEEEAKAQAAEVQVVDGPDDEGNMFERPGKLSDRFPQPYKNDNEAKAANNGALPPDLTFIVNARHGGEDYIFSILTGYCDPPAGITLGEGQAYNPYFPGGAISMAQQLFNEGVEYEDGTPASVSQMAKDVVAFLRFAAEPEHDDRKRIAMKVLTVLVTMIGLTGYYKRHVWTTIKARQMQFKVPASMKIPKDLKS